MELQKKYRVLVLAPEENYSSVSYVPPVAQVCAVSEDEATCNESNEHFQQIETGHRITKSTNKNIILSTIFSYFVL